MTKRSQSPRPAPGGGKMRVLRGEGAAPGIVIARALVFQGQDVPYFRVPLVRQEVRRELSRLDEAKERTKEQLAALKSRTVDALGRTTATSSTRRS